MFSPFIDNNPIALQVLGNLFGFGGYHQTSDGHRNGYFRSFGNRLFQLLHFIVRNYIPNSIRIIVQMAIVASLVTLVDQLLQAFCL